MKKPSWFDDEDGGELLEIDDPRIPQVVREHGRRFCKPACYAHDFGDGAYVLYAQDGELLDLLTYDKP